MTNKSKDRLSQNMLVDLMAAATQQRAALLSTFFDPRRDTYEECGYPTTPSVDEYRKLFDREGLASRVVRVLPEESWQQDPEVYETEDEGQETEFELAWEELEEKHQVLSFLERVDVLSGIGQFGILLLGLSDGQRLEEPVSGLDPTTGKPTTPGKLELLYLRALDQSLVDVSKWNNDPTSPRYGQPEYYNVSFVDPTQGLGSVPPDNHSQRVHWTRCIHIADNRTTSEVLGTPRQSTHYNRLWDTTKILGGSAEMFWKGAFPGLAFELDADAAEAAELDRDEVRAQVEQYMNKLQRYIAVEGLTVKSLAPGLHGPSEHFEVQLKALCIGLAVPLRVFMGSEAAHLASDQDQGTWNGRLDRRRRRYLTPHVVRPTVQRFIDLGVLPAPADGKFTVSWPDLDAPSDLDKAELAAKMTEAIAKYVQAGADVLIEPLDFLTRVLGFDGEEAQAIIDAAEKFSDEGGLGPEEPAPVIVAPGQPPKQPAPVPKQPAPARA